MHLFSGSRYPEINKRISAWVNKNKEFPDYVDVLNLVKKVTKQSSLPLRPETVRVQGKIQRKTYTALLNSVPFIKYIFLGTDFYSHFSKIFCLFLHSSRNIP